MYCDRCGSSLSSTSQFCSSCGKPVAPMSSAYPEATALNRHEDRVHRHIHRLAILWVVNGVLRLMLVLWLYGASRYFTLPNFGLARIWAWPLWHGQVWDSILLILALLFGLRFAILRTHLSVGHWGCTAPAKVTTQE